MFASRNQTIELSLSSLIQEMFCLEIQVPKTRYIILRVWLCSMWPFPHSRGYWQEQLFSVSSKACTQHKSQRAIAVAKCADAALINRIHFPSSYKQRQQELSHKWPTYSRRPLDFLSWGLWLSIFGPFRGLGSYRITRWHQVFSTGWALSVLSDYLVEAWNIGKLKASRW